MGLGAPRAGFVFVTYRLYLIFSLLMTRTTASLMFAFNPGSSLVISLQFTPKSPQRSLLFETVLKGKSSDICSPQQPRHSGGFIGPCLF